ncbi:hypothetical protein OIU79_021484 [Salix purpurea]|uniref:Uncharacterized protein n=1 Tax=Salix purpurea TaxID=77065 RepID=A0A9Q1AGZ8_SALPP|nr:hypothetical protein OIU79_021484 [Salix purpurea]
MYYKFTGTALQTIPGSDESMASQLKLGDAFTIISNSASGHSNYSLSSVLHLSVLQLIQSKQTLSPKR